MQLPDWRAEWKVTAPRVCLAKLVRGRDIEEVNSYLHRAVPITGAGTDWLLHKGDHDFSMVPLTVILYLFGANDDVLYPETRVHLLKKLLILSGPRGSLKAPRSFGFKTETENHILMMEGCRYLKDKWSIIHDGKERSPGFEALERYLTGYLLEKAFNGLREFNSQPYIGYTLTALLMLASFGGTEVSKASRELLDKLNLLYAYGSLNFRRYPPFHRRRDHAGEGWLDMDYHTAMMKVWGHRAGMGMKDPLVRAGHEHALMASILPYDLTPEVIEVLTGKYREALISIGHGRGSSPEIYSRGPGHLISAGGARCSLFTEEVVRPITVLFDDGSRHLDEVIHLGRPDRMLNRPNNTGVHHRFAVSAGPVHVPKGFKEVERSREWALYEHSGYRIAVHSGADPGMVALFPLEGPSVKLSDIIDHNMDGNVLMKKFRFPGGREVRYDLDAPPGRYIITSGTTGQGERDTGKWPLLTSVVLPKR
jgi:hypothetical protein